MKITHKAFINPHNDKLHMKVIFENSNGAIYKTISLKLKQEDYAHVMPMDYVLGDKDLSDCTDLWDLFDEYEDEHLIEEF